MLITGKAVVLQNADVELVHCWADGRYTRRFLADRGTLVTEHIGANDVPIIRKIDKPNDISVMMSFDAEGRVASSPRDLGPRFNHYRKMLARHHNALAKGPV